MRHGRRCALLTVPPVTRYGTPRDRGFSRPLFRTNIAGVAIAVPVHDPYGAHVLMVHAVASRR